MSRRRHWLLLALAGALAAVPARAQEGIEGAGGRARRQGPRPRAERLFAEAAPLAFTLTFDRKVVFRDRDTLSTQVHPASARFSDGRELPIALRTRGHFRLHGGACDFPPLRLGFPKDSARGTPFEDARTLKLVTHCRGLPQYEELVRREHLAYRLLQVLTPRSFRSRLAHVTYVDARDSTKRETRTGLLLEHEADVGDRLGLVPFEDSRGYYWPDMASEPSALVSAFQYLVANTDWSLPYLHNIRIYADSAGAMIPIPYDFDWSGLVDAPYAIPDPKLGIRSVRDRLYRGPCASPEVMAPVRAHVQAHRAALRAVIDSIPGLSPGYRRETAAWLEEFFRDFDDARRWDGIMRATCDRRK